MPWLAETNERLDGFRTGDRELLAEVYRRYAPDLSKRLSMGWVLEIEGKRGIFKGWLSLFETEDLVQETFLRAFADGARLAYDGSRPFGPWIAVICRNLLLDRYRSARRASRVFHPMSDDERMDQFADQNPLASPEARLFDKEVASMLGSFEEQLDDKDRLLVRLRFAERVPRRLVSQQLKLSARQVEWREKGLFQRLLMHFNGRAMASRKEANSP